MTRIVIPVLLCLCCIAAPLFAQEAPAEDSGDYPLSDEDWNWDDADLMEGEGITITSTTARSQQMTVIDREEIEKANAPDLASLLEESAGLGTARYGPYGSQGDINLRGFDAERVAFLIDGIPANAPGSGEFDYSQIDLHSIERIEIIYGGSDSRYNVSGAIGGVINIITVKKQKPGLRFSGGVSNMSALPGRYYQPNAGDKEAQWQDLADTQNINVSAALGLNNFSLAANWFGNRAANHFLYDDPYGRRRRKESNEIWDTGFSVSTINEFSNLSKLIINGSFYYGDKNIPPSGYSELFDKLYDISARENVMLEMPRALHDTLAMDASISHSMQRMDSAGTPSSFQSIMGINRWSWYPALALTLRSGWDYRYAFVKTAAFHDRHDGGLYLTAEWLPVTAFTIIPSIKLAAESGGRLVPVPKLGLLWKPDSAIIIKNNYFRSFKFPDLVDLYWQDSSSRGDPDLKPEDGWGGDIGISWNHLTEHGLRVTLEQNAYIQWYDNSIHWYGGAGGWKPRNVGGAFFHGLDTNARFVLPLRRSSLTSLSFSLSGQYMTSYLLAYGYTFESDKRIPYMPAIRAGAHIELVWKTGSAALAGSYTGLRYAEDFITALDPYFLLTVNVNQKIGKQFSAFGVVRNALNQFYHSFKDYPMPGITLTLGIKVQFENQKLGAPNE